MAKRLIAALLVLTLLGLLVLALLPAPVAVSVTPARRGPFVEWIEDEGRTELREPYAVTAPIDGYLRRVALAPGDSVALDQVLFELEPLPAAGLDPRTRAQALGWEAAARAQLAVAEASLAARQTESDLANLEYERSEPLHQRQLIPAEERDRRLARRESAAAATRSARSAVEVARFELEAIHALIEIAAGKRAPDEQPVLAVRAPVGGIITRRQRCCEGPIQAGEPVIEIGVLERLEVKVDLLSVDAVRVRPGMRVDLERWGGTEPLRGRVRLVEPAGFEKISALGVEERRVPVWVEILSPREQWPTLGEGYRVEARFVLWEGEDILQVPTSALFRHRDGWATYIAEAGQARLRAVEVGRQSGLWSQISAGLAPDELVLVRPGDRVGDGVKIAAEVEQDH